MTLLIDICLTKSKTLCTHRLSLCNAYQVCLTLPRTVASQELPFMNSQRMDNGGAVALWLFGSLAR